MQELDSLCAVIRLAHGLWEAGGDHLVFHEPGWLSAMELAVATMRREQRPGGVRDTPYRFQRTTHWQTDGVAGDGGSHFWAPCCVQREAAALLLLVLCRAFFLLGRSSPEIPRAIIPSPPPGFFCHHTWQDLGTRSSRAE